MQYNAKCGFVRVKYNPKLDHGSLENVKNILDASPLQGVTECIHEITDNLISAEETFIRNCIVEVGVDPDALIRTAKLNARLQTVLKNTLTELEEAKRNLKEKQIESAGLLLTIDGATGYFPKAFIVDAIKAYRKQSEGRWEIVIGSNGKEKMVCTNCRHGQDLESTFTYCPNCGAKMKEGAE